MQSTTVSVLRDLQLTVRRADGTSATVNLDNGYLDYKSDPNRFDDLITAMRRRSQSPAACQARSHAHRARDQDRPWLAQLRDIFIKQDASQQPVFDDFNNELVVVYAEDSNSRTRYLSSSVA